MILKSTGSMEPVEPALMITLLLNDVIIFQDILPTSINYQKSNCIIHTELCQKIFSNFFNSLVLSISKVGKERKCHPTMTRRSIKGSKPLSDVGEQDRTL